MKIGGSYCLLLLYVQFCLLAAMCKFCSAEGPGENNKVAPQPCEKMMCSGCRDGIPGIPGAPGIPGNNGFPGSTPPKGEMGATGPKGDKGEQGPVGVPGERGQQGEKGAVGPSSVGQRGQKGEMGFPGPVGEMGRVGPRGPVGEPGERGEKGETGQKGEPGILEKVQQPMKVAFSAARRKVLDNDNSYGINVTYDRVYSNHGDGLDHLTGVFTSPVDGAYLFIYSGMKSLDKELHMCLKKNGQTKPCIHSRHSEGGKHGSSSNSVILDLVKNDKVWLQLSDYSSILESNHDFTTFTGTLLFQNIVLTSSLEN
ncbi:complement C1q tumor necrosis factor-related protein 3-like [Ptychodera flava]|uniref:complement C1q tumor necrosis factor-related protein 3-like n=1 Tax=Ptychodera flava TaxID=63121 RepID=UPI00396A2EF1